MIRAVAPIKRGLAVLVLLALSVSASLAQGTVNFFNTATTLVSNGIGGHPIGYLHPSVGAWFFGLLIAPTGTTNPLQFSFANVYATNLSLAGRFFGGSGVMVPEWPAGTSESFMVAGWSASLGHDWNQAWLRGDFAIDGWFGLSPVSTSLPGNLFGGATGIQTGWAVWPIGAVPEPSSGVLGLVGAVTLVLFRRLKNGMFKGRVK